jgi:hypothetical protein
VFNLFSTIININTLYGGSEKENFTYKTEFNINENTDSPNVYFIVFDTMTSPYVAEHYFNAKIEPAIMNLKNMGFYVTEEHRIFGFGFTDYVIPALLSPWYYDNYLEELYSQYENRAYSTSSLNRMINEISNGTAELFMPGMIMGNVYYEFKEAFLQKGYNVLFQKYGSNELTEYMEYTLSDKTVEIGGGMFNIIKMATPYYDLSIMWDVFLNRIFDDEYSIAESYIHSDEYRMEENVIKRFEAIVEKSRNKYKPILVYIHEMGAHNPYIFNADGSVKTIEEVMKQSWIEAYRDQYEYNLSLLPKIAEILINNDPNAVIIITGDHGPHAFNAIGLSNLYGYTVEDFNKILNQVFFAVYLGGNEVDMEYIFHTPLNAARYLVNTYVGENYEYILD